VIQVESITHFSQVKRNRITKQKAWKSAHAPGGHVNQKCATNEIKRKDLAEEAHAMHMKAAPLQKKTDAPEQHKTPSGIRNFNAPAPEQGE
jgi:hypothetical protein